MLSSSSNTGDEMVAQIALVPVEMRCANGALNDILVEHDQGLAIEIAADAQDPVIVIAKHHAGCLHAAEHDDVRAALSMRVASRSPPTNSSGPPSRFAFVIALATRTSPRAATAMMR